VNIDGISGYVEDITMLSTIIRTYDGLYIRMPNQKVFTTNITNYVKNTARRFEYVVGIRYSDDADRAIEIIRDIIEDHPFALKNPSPSVFVDNLGDNAVNILVKIWGPSTEWYGVKTELLWKIKKTLEENGIEIAFPQRVVWFANEPGKHETESGEAGSVTT
jgi:small-conductance mechanosensitive channel